MIKVLLKCSEVLTHRLVIFRTVAIFLAFYFRLRLLRRIYVWRLH